MENYKIDRQVLTLKDMLAILSAMSNRLLFYVYRNSKGELIERTVEPMTLVFYYRKVESKLVYNQ